MEEDIRRALSPTQEEISAMRAVSTDGEIVGEILGSIGGRALDVGCGDGRFTRTLAGLFRHVSAIDIKAEKIDLAKKAAAAAGIPLDFRVGSGEDIGYPDATFDCVAFSNSLHHMPHPAAALREALRVLKPQGALYVMEPVPAGNYHDATKLVSDETEVKTLAYRALHGLSPREIRSQREIMYRTPCEFADFEAWLAHQVDRDPKRRARFDAQPEEVRRRFEAGARRKSGGVAFDRVFRVNLLRKGP